MAAELVILTGASGSGKTTLALAVQRALRDQPRGGSKICFFDSVGVPSPTSMQAFGDGHDPGGAWQRAITFQWIEGIAHDLRTGTSVLLEGQMRPAFIREALSRFHILHAKVFLVDCDDATRLHRLTQDRAQPELANASMLGWAQYLRKEASELDCELLDTGITPFAACVHRLVQALNP